MRIKLFPIVVALIGLVLLLELMFGVAYSQTPPAPVSEPTLSACDTAEISVIRLREQIVELAKQNLALQNALLELQTRAESSMLDTRRAELEERFRKSFSPPDGSVFNWKTLKFDPPSPKK